MTTMGAGSPKGNPTKPRLAYFSAAIKDDTWLEDEKPWTNAKQDKTWRQKHKLELSQVDRSMCLTYLKSLSSMA